MNLEQLLDTLRDDQDFMSCVTNWHVAPAREARYVPWPDGLHPKVLEAVARTGHQPLYPSGQAISLRRGA